MTMIVFLSWNGERLPSREIQKAVKLVWKKADIDVTIHTTILRKSAVPGTDSTTDSSETQRDLAHLMAHNGHCKELLQDKREVKVIR